MTTVHAIRCDLCGVTSTEEYTPPARWVHVVVNDGGNEKRFDFCKSCKFKAVPFAFKHSPENRE